MARLGDNLVGLSQMSKSNDYNALHPQHLL